jgi:HAE1 family hydrophobic/amphiphilic exporter-1
MPGVAGQWFKPFALTIACAVLVSLFVSFSLDPMLSAYWADPQLEAHERRNPIARALTRFNIWFDHQADRYKSLIAWSLDHRWTMVGLAALSFFLAIALQIAIGGFAFVPVSDQSELNIAIETPPGSSLDYTSLKAEEVARMVRTRPEVLYTYTTVGSSTGSGEVDNASVYVRLEPKKDRSLSQEDLGQILRKKLRLLGGANAFTYASGFGGAQKQLQLQLQGPDPTTLGQLAERIEGIVSSTPGAVDVGLSTRGQKPELNVRVNRGLAGTLGVNLSQLANSLRFAFAGVDAGTWVDPMGISRYVHVRLVPESRANADDLGRLPIVVTPPAPNANAATRAGASSSPPVVPLGQVATITPSFGPAQIDHYQRQRVITIGANVEGASFGNVSSQIMKKVSKLQLPAGYRVSAGGQAESQSQVFGSIFTALGIAVMLMYLILVVQFGSFLDPLAILLSLPLSLIGVVLALLITGDTLNLMSLIGVILLMGIVAKNAILLIDFAKWAHKDRGVDRREALIEAGRIRLRPILMTTLALIAGMVPVALGLGEGADFRAPLGRAVIGGVVTSTVLTLVVIPTIYEILDEWREWLFARFRRPVVAHRPITAESPGD